MTAKTPGAPTRLSGRSYSPRLADVDESSDQTFFRQLWQDLLARWPVQQVHQVRETGPVPAKASVSPFTRIHLVVHGQQQIAWGHGGRSQPHVLDPSQVLLGLPQCWDRSRRSRADAVGAGIIFEEPCIRFVYKDFRQFQVRRPDGPDRQHRTSSRLPAAGRHLVAALRDCGPRPLADPVLLGTVHALVQLAWEHLCSDAPSPLDRSEALWRRIRLLLQERCHNNISRAGIARQFGLHPSTISVLAKRYEGQSYIAVLNGFRLLRARELLRQGGLGIAEVASRSGFGSSTYLARLFRRRYGHSPAEWQQRAGTVEATGPHGTTPL
jgi:AraC-like DNA-binding protein